MYKVGYGEGKIIPSSRYLLGFDFKIPASSNVFDEGRLVRDFLRFVETFDPRCSQPLIGSCADIDAKACDIIN